MTPIMDQIIENFKDDENEQTSFAKMLNELSAKDLDTQALVAKKATYMNRVLNYFLKSFFSTNLEYENEVTQLQRHVAIREEAIERLQKQIGHADLK